MQTTESIIQSIIDVVDIGPDRTVNFADKPFSIFHSSGDNKIISLEMLQQNLKNLIYGEFYTQGKVSTKYREDDDDTNDREDRGMRQEFIQALRKANVSQNGWSKGWKVESTAANGAIHVKRGNASRNVYAGEFIKQQFTHQFPQPGEYIKIISRKEYTQDHEAFYYAFGNILTEDEPQMLARFYFNVFPEGAVKLMERLTSTFNNYGIPFQFKCLADPYSYNRTDSAVLYFNKRYEKIVFDIVSAIYNDERRFFKVLCPLFALKISDGFAFAENPIDPNESFGTSRANLIAHGMATAFSADADKREWYDYVRQAASVLNYELDKFHLNPGTHYPYSFNHEQYHYELI